MRQKYLPTYKFMLWAVMAIFVICPFYTPLTVWAASHLEHFDFFRIWKELALSILAIAVVSFLVAHRKLAVPLFKSRLLLLTLAYIVLVLIVGVYDLVTDRVSREAVIYGWLINLRHVGFFTVVVLILTISPLKISRNFPWQKLLLFPAAFVIVFGLLQMTVLPPDVLTHIGYGETTTQPYGTIDNQKDLVRIQSTLRGPNPLGAYLLLIITVLTASALAVSNIRRRIYIYGAIIGGIAVIIGTYSRSAAIGLALSTVILYVTYNKSFINKHILGFGLVALGLIVAGIFLFRQNSYLIENFIFHSSDDSTSQLSSNDQRYRALTGGLEDVVEHPLGSGVGSAGPASLRNEHGNPELAENYYLQLAQEAGFVAMALFLAINVVIARELWKLKSNPLALALFASLVGLTFVNMLSHAWADDTLAYIWWGLAGVALAPAILKPRHKHNV